MYMGSSSYGMADVSSLPGMAARSSRVNAVKPSTQGLLMSVWFGHPCGTASKSSTVPAHGAPVLCSTVAASCATNGALAAALGRCGIKASVAEPSGLWSKCAPAACASRSSSGASVAGVYGVVMNWPAIMLQSQCWQSVAEPCIHRTAESESLADERSSRATVHRTGTANSEC